MRRFLDVRSEHFMEVAAMKVRNVGWTALAFVFAAIVTPAAQAEGHRPSRRTLDEMGLGSMVIMSDAEAMRIRGHGFNGHGGSSVSVFGNSFATFSLPPFGTSHSENGYSADGKHFAHGKNFSKAGVEITTRRGHGKHGGKHFGRMGGKVWPVGMGRKHGGMGHRSPGRPKVTSVKVFAGGHSSAFAF